MMKKLFPLITILLFSVGLKAQTNSNKQFPISETCQSVMKELTDLHQRTVKLFNEKNYDEAFPLSKKMSEIAEASCMEAKDKRLMLAINVADIQIKRGKKIEAQKIYDKNLALAAEVHGENNINFNNYLDFLIKLSIDEVSNEKFEQYALKSIEVKVNVFGNQSYEVAKELLRMAIFYRRDVPINFSRKSSSLKIY